MVSASLVFLNHILFVEMRCLRLQKATEIQTHGAVVAFVEELVLIHKEVTTGFVLVLLAVTAQRAAAVIEIRTLSFEQLELW